MEIDDNTNVHSTIETQKSGLLKLKKILKPLLSRKNSKKSYRIRGLNFLSSSHNSTHSRSKSIDVTITSFNTKDTSSMSDEEDYDHQSHSSLGTWTSERGNNDIETFEFEYDREEGQEPKPKSSVAPYASNLIGSKSIDIKDLYLSKILTLTEPDAFHSISSQTLFVKDPLIDPRPRDSSCSDSSLSLSTTSESESLFGSEDTSSSVSTPSLLSLGSFHAKYPDLLPRIHSSTNTKPKINSESSPSSRDLQSSSTMTSGRSFPPSPPLTPQTSTPLPPSHDSCHRYSNAISTPTPSLISYFPSEILLQIAMSTDFETLLYLRQTCRFFRNLLSDPKHWSDYWHYTSDRVECLNSLVTNVFQGDEYIFGEVIDSQSDKFLLSQGVQDEYDKPEEKGLRQSESLTKEWITNPSLSSTTTTTTTTTTSSHSCRRRHPKFWYPMPQSPNDLIPIERVLFIDSFSTRHGFSYLGGLRIYVPDEPGHIITHFYDRPVSERPCSYQHYQDYERRKFCRDLSSSSSSSSSSSLSSLPPSIQECPSCSHYYQANVIDYTVTCSGRPVSHISAIWKYSVTPHFSISFDIVNARSEHGYGYRSPEAFIHTNYAFLVNGQELSPAKASLFRKYVLRNP